jgi:dTDP-4-dehydrorhamnose reductase
VHVSTDFIFDGIDGPYREEDQPAPLSYYGESKLAAEQLVLESGLPAAIVRTVLVYGIAEDMSRSNIVLWAKGALEKNQPIKVVDDQFRTPTLAEDLAMGCFLAATKKAEGIFNISGKDFMSIRELVGRVAIYFNLDDSLVETVSSRTLNQKAKRPPRTGFILDKAEKELGYQPHSFEEGIAIVMSQLPN